MAISGFCTGAVLSSGPATDEALPHGQPSCLHPRPGRRLMALLLALACIAAILANTRNRALAGDPSGIYLGLVIIMASFNILLGVLTKVAGLN